VRRDRLRPLLGLALLGACFAGVAVWRVTSRPPDVAPAAREPPPPPAPVTGGAPAAAPSRPTSAPPRIALSPADKAALEEAPFMARLRELAGRDPASAVALAREGNRRFGKSPDAPERTSILIHALADLGRGMEARGEAERMVNDDPDSSWVREIERFTGAHRHRNVRVSDAGVLEYYE
jgi:hypothetical protein